MQRLPRLATLLTILVLSGCNITARGPEPPPLASSLTQWVQAHPLAPQLNIAISEVARTETSSVHVVQVRRAEELHVHRTHDAVALIHQGYGTLRLGARVLRLEPGSVVVIPRNVPHAFENLSLEPAAIFVVFSPPFDGLDKVPVAEPLSR